MLTFGRIIAMVNDRVVTTIMNAHYTLAVVLEINRFDCSNYVPILQIVFSLSYIFCMDSRSLLALN